ncbi:MAG: hypothetical protein ACKPE1_02035 [Dolichospermum sp.]
MKLVPIVGGVVGAGFDGTFVNKCGNVSRRALKIVVGAREQGTGNREQVFGNFTFCYLCRFFSVHLLSKKSI